MPENAQGEVQGGLSVVTNITMLAGTVFYAQLFGWFMGDAEPFRSPNVPFFVAGAGTGTMLTLALYLGRIEHDGAKA